MPHRDDVRPEPGEFHEVKEGDRCVALVHVPRPPRKLSEQEREIIRVAVRPLVPASRIAKMLLALALSESADA